MERPLCYHNSSIWLLRPCGRHPYGFVLQLSVLYGTIDPYGFHPPLPDQVLGWEATLPTLRYVLLSCSTCQTLTSRRPGWVLPARNICDLCRPLLLPPSLLFSSLARVHVPSAIGNAIRITITIPRPALRYQPRIDFIVIAAAAVKEIPSISFSPETPFFLRPVARPRALEKQHLPVCPPASHLFAMCHEHYPRSRSLSADERARVGVQ
jgi:hypothetical protein